MQSRDKIQFNFFLEVLKDLPSHLVERIQNMVTWEEIESLEDEIYSCLSASRNSTTATEHTEIFLHIAKTVPMFIKSFYSENSSKHAIVARRESLASLEPISSQEPDISIPQVTQEQVAAEAGGHNVRVHELILNGRQSQAREAFDNLTFYKIERGRTGKCRDERARQVAPKTRATFHNVLAFYKSSVKRPAPEAEPPAKKHFRPWE